MAGFLSRSLFFLLVSGAVAYAASAAPPRDTAPPIEETGAGFAGEAPADSEDDTPARPVISVAPVGKPSIEGFGTLEESNGGLPASVWQGSTRESAAALLQQIHSGVANDTLQGLATRLLMTQAAPPAGAGENWFVLRVNALIALGQDEKAEQMISSLPASMSNDSLRRTHVELMLLRGDTDSACRFAASLPDSSAGGEGDAVFWQKMNILCKARAGKQNEVMVGLDVLHEENKQSDMFFQEAVHKMDDKKAAIKALPKEWSLLDVALIRLAGDTATLKDKMDALPPVALKYIARDTSLDVKLREKATIRAEQLAILPVKEGNKTPEQPFTRALASDVTTLVTALGSDKPANAADNAVIERLALGEGSSILDSRRVQRLLTFMQPFGYRVPAAVWQKLFAHKSRFDGEVPPAVLVADMNEAAHAGKKGEVILLAALIIDGNDTDRASELALLPVVNALKAAGFEKEARHLAYSAVKSYSGR